MYGRIFTVATLGLFLCACGGSVSSHDEAMESQIDLIEEMIGILEGVTDEASAKKAEPEMQALGKKAQELSEQIQKLPDPDPEQMKKLEKKYAERIDALQKRMMQQMMKMMEYPDLAKASSEAMDGVK